MSQNYQQIQQTDIRRQSTSSRIFFIEDEQNFIPQVYYPREEDFVQTQTKEHRRILFIVEPIIIGLILFPIIVLFWQCGWNLVLILLDLVNGYPLHGSGQSSEMEESKTLPVSQKSAGKEYLPKFDRKGKDPSRPSPFPIENYDPSILNPEEGDYSSQSLIISYVIVQVFLLCFYLGQDIFSNFLKRQNNFIEIILLKCHIFLLASIYIIQWVMIWTICDQYTPHEWYFELLLSLTFLFVLFIFAGHLSDLICAPFIISYDCIEYCLQINCPLLTREVSLIFNINRRMKMFYFFFLYLKMKKWKINLINFIFYDIILSNITIIVWRGFYNFVDRYFYPDDFIRSAWICLLIGYILYFILMYFQNYLEDFNLKHEFWILISMNFPQFYRNIRHFLAFISCLFLWRGFWLIYDLYVDIFELYYQTYLLFYLLSFLFLALIQTASSLNGPSNNIEDENRFFPLYPNCYVSTTVRKFLQLPFFRSENAKEDIKS
jgi:hypothetical protein